MVALGGIAERMEGFALRTPYIVICAGVAVVLIAVAYRVSVPADSPESSHFPESPASTEPYARDGEATVASPLPSPASDDEQGLADGEDGPDAVSDSQDPSLSGVPTIPAAVESHLEPVEQIIMDTRIPVRSQHERLDQRLMDEPVDPNWSPMMESAIVSVLASTQVPYPDDVQCRTSICRAILTYDIDPPADGGLPDIDLSEIGISLQPLLESQIQRLKAMSINLIPVPGPEGDLFEAHVYLLSPN